MAWTNGTVTGYKAFLEKIKDYATRDKEAGTPVAGTNTGDGIVYGASASELAAVETITLTCTTAGGNDVGIFSVVGGTTGAMGTATVGVPFTSTGGEVSFTILGGTVAFDNGTVTTDSFTIPVTTIVDAKPWAAPAVAGGGNTGDGTLVEQEAGLTSVAETWTITAKADPTTFTVVGSVTGALADAIVDVQYSTSTISFKVSSGGTAFVTGDVFTVEVDMSARWRIDRWDTDYDGSGGYELIMHGEGITGSDEIYFGIQSKDTGVISGSFRNYALTGFLPGLPMANQPGAHTEEIYTPLWASPMPYWLWDFKDGIKFVARCDTSHEHSYLGWSERFESPSQREYPMISGGSAQLESVNYNTVSGSHRAYWTTGTKDTERTCLFLNYAEWLPKTSLDGIIDVYPRTTQSLSGIDLVVGEPASVWSYVLVIADRNIIAGSLLGVNGVVAGNSVSNEDVLITLEDVYIVFKDTYRTSIFCAMDMI